jgi:hypothetical protein
MEAASLNQRVCGWRRRIDGEEEASGQKEHG